MEPVLPTWYARVIPDSAGTHRAPRRFSIAASGKGVTSRRPPAWRSAIRVPCASSRMPPVSWRAESAFAEHFHRAIRDRAAGTGSDCKSADSTLIRLRVSARAGRTPQPMSRPACWARASWLIAETLGSVDRVRRITGAHAARARVFMAPRPPRRCVGHRGSDVRAAGERQRGRCDLEAQLGRSGRNRFAFRDPGRW